MPGSKRPELGDGSAGTDRCSDSIRGVDSRVALILKRLETLGSNASLRLHDVAGDLTLSERQIRFLFKRTTGFTFRANLQKIRLEQASGRLRQGDYSMKYIAGVVGFYDTSSLDRAFRRSLGTTPTEYRRKQCAE